MTDWSKISGKLSTLMSTRPAGTVVRVSIMLDKGTSGPATESLARNLAATTRSTVAPVVLQASGIVVLDTTLEQVRTIVQRPEVVWVDTNTVANIEDLLDR